MFFIFLILFLQIVCIMSLPVVIQIIIGFGSIIQKKIRNSPTPGVPLIITSISLGKKLGTKEPQALKEIGTLIEQETGI